MFHYPISVSQLSNSNRAAEREKLLARVGKELPKSILSSHFCGAFVDFALPAVGHLWSILDCD
jgi:hypothetical protein